MAALAGPARAAGPPHPGPVPRALRPGGEFDRFVARLAAQDDFSGNVLLMHGNRPVLARAHGMADKKKAVPNGPDTIYALGSITKMFTSIAVAQLAQQGKLEFTDYLGAHLSGFPKEIADTVTVHQLLTHTSGMGDFMQTDGFLDQARKWTSADQVMDGLLKLVRTESLVFTPGSRVGYSNSGYHVLGEIVAKISGQSYYSYIREHIFAPAGMTDSDFYTMPQWRDDERIGNPYTTTSSGERVEAFDQHFFMGSPSGDSFSPAPDLARFARTLLSNKLLSPAYTELVVCPKIPALPPPPPPGRPQLPTMFNAYAPSAFLINGQWAVGHTGGSPGESANLEWYPAIDWMLVKLSNYDVRTTSQVDAMARQLITGG
ncbi:serine hydrolase domain-containing protein [Actinomadura rubteroloni]|nr:serine hydrolase domain-containing protein [Actinomadura rubteroloni]